MKIPPRRAILVLLLILFFSVSPTTLSAHGGAGLIFSAVANEESGPVRYVDVDYTETSIIARDSVGRFTFNLFADKERTQSVEYTDMWIRIVQDNGGRVGNTVFAGPIYPVQYGGAGFLFRFAESGKYTLYVRYNDAKKGILGEALAEVEFPLDVLRSSDENKFNFGMEFWVGLIGGLFIAVVGLLPILTLQKK